MDKVLKELSLIGIVPVIKIEDADKAVPLAEALCRGGLNCAEVTFRTSAAKEAIARISAECPDMIIGAGTVLTEAQVDDAIAAGAKFIVSPGLNPKIVRYCQSKGVPIVPGINNPTGIEQALELGLDTVKFFPAEQSGGLEMIKAMSAPYGSVRFMPTGGVSEANVCAYLANPKIIACGGSWMVKAELIEAEKYDEIERMTRAAVDKMLGFSLLHIGVNCENEDECRASSDFMANAFSFDLKEGEKSIFAGEGFEFMKYVGRGSRGHIAIKTNSVDRAVYHLSRRGVKFDSSTAVIAPNGKFKFIYLADEISGFAYHLVE